MEYMIMEALFLFMKNHSIEFGGIIMDIKKPENNESLDAMLDPGADSDTKEVTEDNIAEKPDSLEGKQEKPVSDVSDKKLRTLSVGEWMLVIFAFLIPVINIIFMAVWAFSSEGNVHRRNLSRAALLWIIILLIAYVVAMTIAGFTILDLFV